MLIIVVQSIIKQTSVIEKLLSSFSFGLKNFFNLFQIFFITLENLKETNLKFQRCHQCKKIFSERNRSKYCSPQCGEKAKYLRYIAKGFNKDYHRIRKKLYQLHERTTRNRLSKSDFFSLYEEFKSELSLLTLTSRTLEDFLN